MEGVGVVGCRHIRGKRGGERESGEEVAICENKGIICLRYLYYLYISKTHILKQHQDSTIVQEIRCNHESIEKIDMAYGRSAAVSLSAH